LFFPSYGVFGEWMFIISTRNCNCGCNIGWIVWDLTCFGCVPTVVGQ
jgi:hypothetical protein